jgi:hypothetical protein
MGGNKVCGVNGSGFQGNLYIAKLADFEADGFDRGVC